MIQYNICRGLRMTDKTTELIQELKKRLAYEHLLSQISAMAVNLTDISAFQNKSLKLLGEITGVDRTYIFEYRDDAGTIDNTFEWCAPGVEPQIDNLQKVEQTDFKWWTDILRNEGMIHYKDIKKITEQNVRELLEKQSIVSILVVPLLLKEDLYGFIGFDSCRSQIEYSETDIELIKTVSRIVCDAILRFKTKTQLIMGQQQLLSIFDSISEPVYVADTDTYEILFVNKFLKNVFDRNIVGEKCYKTLQNFDSPCSFCTNNLLKQIAPEPYRWEFYNHKLDRHYSICDRLIEWPNGKKVRLELTADITDLKRAENALRKSEQRMSLVFDAINEAYWDWHVPSGKVYFSPNAFTMLGFDPDEFEPSFTSWQNLVHPDDLKKVLLQLDKHLHSEKSEKYQADYRMQTRSGEYKWIMGRGKVIERDEDGEAIRFVGCHTDISEQKAAEERQQILREQLAHSRKIESVGRLAGGIAHDFNNMLGVIIGHCEMILRKIPADNPFLQHLKEIERAASRSADLTRQLLAYARKQTIKPKTLDINITIDNMLKMLRRLIGEDIELSWQPGPDIWKIKMDPVQIDQILTNLCLNARDAVGENGKITIETANTKFDELSRSTHSGMLPGDFVMLSVSDNGHGMNKETMANIFEPFFTTKEMGRGTGLGLATIYGIIKQNNGFINVYSEPDCGTNFKVYLPRNFSNESAAVATQDHFISQATNATILVVEDEKSLLELNASYLKSVGYQVLAAASPAEALELVNKQHIDLLLTDVIMPEMNGRVLSEKIKAIQPDIKILFMSGYSSDVIVNQGILEEGCAYIQKPYSLKNLGIRLEKMLNR